MKFEIETLPNCIASVRVEVPAERVEKERARIVGQFQSAAKLPGYRPGKVPQPIVESRYKKEIRDELLSTLINQGTREAIKENKLKVLSVSNVEDVELVDGAPMVFKATLVTAPEFELPEYKGIQVQVPPEEIADEQVDAMIERLREQHADFKDLEGRALAMGDFAVIDYKGTIDGAPVADVVPKAGRFVGGQEDFWIRIEDSSFLPGFCAHLQGLEIGGTKEFDLELPADFPAKELASKQVHYTVTLKAIKERVLPEVDDDFAKRFLPDSDLAGLKDRIRTEMLDQHRADVERSKRDQIVNRLLDSVECELPEEMVKSETRRVLEQIVEENTNRGVEEEVLQENKAEILANAGKGARNRVKSAFILSRIAEKEGIRVTAADLEAQIGRLSLRYRMAPEKLKKELTKRNALGAVEEEVLIGKVLDFLSSNASVEVVQPAPAAQA
jgi:trigger factor